MPQMPPPLVLVVLDGWGLSAHPDHNAIALARTPAYRELVDQYPHAALVASGEAVGLPAGQMGNSEVGHMNLGAGRVVYQDLTRIDLAIRDGALFDNEVLAAALDRCAGDRHALHLVGLVSDGGVGWHLENHLPLGVFALAYWSWLFAPLPGAFVNAFQTGPADLYWPDFFKSRQAICEDPLDGPLKPRLEATAGAKAGIANRLFSWHRYTREVAETVTANIPEADLRALVEIVREDLAGKRSGFPDLTVIYGPGRYEFVEVKGPGDQLQIHQRLWIEALERRGLPVRVLRYRRPPQ